MDEQEILSRIDARGRAAATGARHAVADTPVPAFDPDAHPVAITATSVRRWSRRRAVALAGVAALALAVVGVVTLGSDGDSGTADRVGTVEPARRFVAGHLPDGFVPSFVSAGSPGSSGSSADISATMPTEMYGPDVADPRMAVAVAPDEAGPGIGFEGEGRPTWVATTFGDRDGFFMVDEDFLGWYGVMVVVEGRDVMVFGPEDDQPVLEQVAATVELADGEVVVDSPDRPDGWRHLGQVDVMALYAQMGLGPGGSGSSYIGYFGPPVTSEDGVETRASVTVAVVPGDVLEMMAVAVIPWWPGLARGEEVMVRGHPALLQGSPDGSFGMVAGIETWMVSWVERPGEVIRVTGSMVGRDEVLAVAEEVRPARPDEWAELERASLRDGFRAMEGEVVLGEGSFSDGSPWLLTVHPEGGFDGGSTMLPEAMGESSGESVVGGPIPSDVERGGTTTPRIELRTTADMHTGVSSASSGTSSTFGGEQPEVAFPYGVSAEGGDSLAWAYGLVGSDVATVELVSADGEVLATVEVLSAEGYGGFLIELPLEVAALTGVAGPVAGPGGPTTTLVEPAEGGWETTVPASASGGDSALPSEFDDLSSDRPVLVARAADGTELGRHPLP